ncbi:hypothetical protein [Methylovulum miyakonense]|uniref:hypothetical protein n=1 Tax=Methylovulum miyakonense TaxID=645578 RepID=UPI00038177C7|nr:hypothetical protein [Methylovulum miyakonense]
MGEDSGEQDVLLLLTQTYDQERIRDLNILPKLMPGLVRASAIIGELPIGYIRRYLKLIDAPVGNKKVIMVEAWGWLYNNQHELPYTVAPVDMGLVAEWFPQTSFATCNELSKLDVSQVLLKPRPTKPWWRRNQRW